MIIFAKKKTWMTIIHKIKQRFEVFWQVRVAKIQYPMLTTISRKKWSSKGAFGFICIPYHITDKDSKHVQI